MTWPVPIAFFSSDICTSVYSVILGGFLWQVVITSLMKLLLENMLRTDEMSSTMICRGIFAGILFLSLLYLEFWVIRWSIISSGVSRLTTLLTFRGALPCWRPCLIISFCWDVSCLQGVVVALSLSCTTLVVYSPMSSTTAVVISGLQSNHVILFFHSWNFCPIPNTFA